MRDRKNAEEKARLLVSRMTVEEKASQLRFDSPAIERLHIPAYNWWNEALHGVARAGTATMFPQAIALAAMFDDEAMVKIGDVIATEGRAKYNAQSKQGDRDIYKGLTFWSPNINIFRDPRWGRGHETYGEDPFLTSRLGVAFVRGLQGNGPVMKAAACAKHFAVHSGPEALRHEFNAVASEKDMRETYLPAFEALVKEAGVEAVMGAYNRTNGEPCCGSTTLLKKILRGEWAFRGHVVSDCWAIRDFHERHKVTKNAEESVAMALHAGCDVNCGCTYQHVLDAYRKGMVSEDEITQAAVRLFTTRYLLGLFDGSEYDNIGYDVVECRRHTELAVDAARESIVLLKNSGILPLDKKRLHAIGVIGPNADSRVALQGNYHGTSSRYSTVLEGIQDEACDSVDIRYSQGCALFKDRVEALAQRQDRMSEALAVAALSDVIILCLGLDETLEGEEGDAGNGYASGDKKDLLLPEPQRELMEKIIATGKPVVVVLLSGSALDLQYADGKAAAVLEAWYPGARGGKAVADILFGHCSPSGKLPVTFYRTLDGFPAFTDYSMKGRTYRYMTGEALYPFGYGLSYGKVDVTHAEITNTVTKDSGIELSVDIENTGHCRTGEVVEVYIKDTDSVCAVRNWSLCAFRRVILSAGEKKCIALTVPAGALQCIDENGHAAVTGHRFKLYVGTSQPDARSVALTGRKPFELEILL